MSCYSPMDIGSEHGSISSGEDELDCQSTSSGEDELVHHRSLSEEHDPDYEPSSSSGDDFDDAFRRARKPKNDVSFHQESITLKRHHLGVDTDLEVGAVITIGETLELCDDSFLEITGIGTSRNNQSVIFRGHLLRRIEDFKDYLPVTSRRSELVLLREAKEHDPKPEGYLRDATSRDVLRTRQLFTAGPESAPELFYETRVAKTLSPLLVQWVLVAELSDSHPTRNKRSFRSIEGGSKRRPKAFVALSSYNSDLPDFSSDRRQSQLERYEYIEGRNKGKGKERSRGALGGTILAPNTKGNRVIKAVYSPTIRRLSHDFAMGLASVLGISSAQRLISEQRMEAHVYTFADAFCGAGGMSIGANDAGLRIQWAFDHDEHAVETYSGNHGNVICEKISAKQFLALRPGNKYETVEVDILHLSPPCQGFSQAAIRGASNKAQDNRCMTYVHKIVDKVKPRIVTFEQVPEVLSNRLFKEMVHALTSIGYSVRWRLLECADFGVPQKRKRLFMIASRQGEQLPDFPKPTHSHYRYCDQRHLQRWNSFQGAIDSLEDSAPNHNVKNPRREREVEYWAPPHPPDWPCHSTITSGGNWPFHYSGKFRCTPREAACLQAFPADYAFRGKSAFIRKQVVNAVPPPIAKAILEEVKKSLMRMDASKRS